MTSRVDFRASSWTVRTAALECQNPAAICNPCNRDYPTLDNPLLSSLNSMDTGPELTAMAEFQCHAGYTGETKQGKIGSGPPSGSHKC